MLSFRSFGDKKGSVNKMVRGEEEQILTFCIIQPKISVKNSEKYTKWLFGILHKEISTNVANTILIFWAYCIKLNKYLVTYVSGIIARRSYKNIRLFGAVYISTDMQWYLSSWYFDVCHNNVLLHIDIIRLNKHMWVVQVIQFLQNNCGAFLIVVKSWLLH